MVNVILTTRIRMSRWPCILEKIGTNKLEAIIVNVAGKAKEKYRDTLKHPIMKACNS